MKLAERSKTDPEITRASVYKGIGTVEQIREHVGRLRAELGVTYFCLRGPDVEKLGPVVQALAGH